MFIPKRFCFQMVFPEKFKNRRDKISRKNDGYNSFRIKWLKNGGNNNYYVNSLKTIPGDRGSWEDWLSKDEARLGWLNEKSIAVSFQPSEARALMTCPPLIYHCDVKAPWKFHTFIGLFQALNMWNKRAFYKKNRGLNGRL